MNIMNNFSYQDAPIGIFDSGAGGLTVVKELFQHLPCEAICYFGDTANCPYGSKSAAKVRYMTLEAVRFLMGSPLKALLIACNTATALVPLQTIINQVTIPVIGVIKPGARTAIKTTKIGSVGIIGTQGTINSRAYERELLELVPNLSIHTSACPSFVNIVESGLADTKEAYEMVALQLKPLLQRNIDTLVLGCTHYPLLGCAIKKTVGTSITVISSALETVSELKVLLAKNHQLSFAAKPKHIFYTTGDPAKFKKLAYTWLSRDIDVIAV